MRRIITTLGALPLAVHWQHVCAAKQKCEKRSASGQWRVREDAEGASVRWHGIFEDKVNGTDHIEDVCLPFGVRSGHGPIWLMPYRNCRSATGLGAMQVPARAVTYIVSSLTSAPSLARSNPGYLLQL